MQLSPVQLLASVIERIRLDPVAGEPDLSAGVNDLAGGLLFYRHCEAAPDFWDQSDSVDEDVRARTFKVRLGLKTGEEAVVKVGYRFEVVASAHVIVSPERVKHLAPEDAATQYGLSVLYGTIRESLINNTSRMRPGRIYLPTFTFVGTKFSDVAGTASNQESLPLEDNQPDRS